MSQYGDELYKFSINGKTVFFNKMQARNGSEYLSINAIYGKGQRERLVLFKEHLPSFWEGLKMSVGEMTGLKPTDEAPQTTPEPVSCPDCGVEGGKTFCRRNRDGTEWVLYCRECYDEEGTRPILLKSSLRAVSNVDIRPEDYDQ